ncbi:centromere protein U isoform X1 [Labrus bergylta]|uniref:centromere protein U isoform X1 n=1 Tax=Labrus bergylta TaxID=56723 RepID=UPI003313412C
MSAKKGRRAKAPKKDEHQRGSAMDDMDSPNLSAIERASFMQGLEPNFGNPLHSTAVEEDLNVSGGQKEEGRKGGPKTSKTFVKHRGAAVKRKETERDDEEEEKKKRSRRSTAGNVMPETEAETKKKRATPQRKRQHLDAERKESDTDDKFQKSNSTTPTVDSARRQVGKKPAKRKSAVQMSATRKVKNQQVTVNKRKSKSGSGESSDPQSQEESDTDTARQTRKTILSSDEEVVDEDTSWNPSQKKTKANSLRGTRKSSPGKSRTSSSGSASAEADKADTETQRSKKQSGQTGTELEVVLDTFRHFCDQYRESVESKAVKQSIDSFSTNVKQQLMEKISANKELRVLKRENVKVGSLICKKTQRLLDAKHETMRAERKVFLLKKEKAELKLRLSDLRRGQAFLQDLRELNRQYLVCRHKHPKKKETYGASSLPALQLENQTTRQQSVTLKKNIPVINWEKDRR